MSKTQVKVKEEDQPLKRTDEAPFKAKETVLVEYGEKWYSAKVLEAYTDRDKDNAFCYFIHYVGWSKKSDELVYDARIKQLTEETAPLAAPKKRSKSTENTKKPKKITFAVSANTSPNIAVKQEQGAVIFSPQINSSKDSKFVYELPNIKEERSSSGDENDSRTMVKMSDRLKVFLTKHCLDVTSRGATPAPLPYNKTVAHLISDYMESEKEDVAGVKDFVMGLRDYFNDMVTKRLLYESEAAQYTQYEEVLKSRNEVVPEMAALYGIQHLLRLFSVIESHLASKYKPGDKQILIRNVNKFLQFLDTNYDKYCVVLSIKAEIQED